MPFKSQAQRRKFYAMAASGEMSVATVKRWEKETGNKELPERVEKKAMFRTGFEKVAGIGFDIYDYATHMKWSDYVQERL